MDEAVAAALESAVARVGDRWSLLLVYTLLDGPKRFSELEESCGIAPNILSRRLEHLRSATVVVAHPYCERPLRHEYALTEEGHQLANALRLLAAWGDRCGPRPTVRHERCGAVAEVRWYCPSCEQVLSKGP